MKLILSLWAMQAGGWLDLGRTVESREGLAGSAKVSAGPCAGGGGRQPPRLREVRLLARQAGPG